MDGAKEGDDQEQTRLDAWLFPLEPPPPPDVDAPLPYDGDDADAVVWWDANSLFKLRMVLQHLNGLTKVSGSASKRPACFHADGVASSELCTTRGSGVTVRAPAHMRVVKGGPVCSFTVDVESLVRALEGRVALWAAVRCDDVIWGVDADGETLVTPLLPSLYVAPSARTAFYEAVLPRAPLAAFLRGSTPFRVSVSELSSAAGTKLPVRVNAVSFSSEDKEKELTFHACSEWGAEKPISNEDDRVAGLDFSALRHWHAFDFPFLVRSWCALLRSPARIGGCPVVTLTFCSDGTLHARVSLGGSAGDLTIAAIPAEIG